MDFRKLRWQFLVPVTLFAAAFEYFRHVSNFGFMESFGHFWENVLAVTIFTIVVAVFSQQLFENIKDLTTTMMDERVKTKTVIRNTSEAIIVLDSDRRIIDINPKGKELTGHEEGEIINCLGGIPLADFKKSQCRKPRCSETQCILHRAFEENATFTDRGVRFVTANGARVYVRANSCFIHTGDKRCLAIFLQDITDSYTREKQSRLLYEIGLGILSIKDVNHNMQAVIGNIQQVFDADLAMWFSRTNRELDLKPSAYSWSGNFDSDQFNEQIMDKLFDNVFVAGKPLFIDSKKELERYSSLARFDLDAVVVAPIIYNEQNFGILIIGWQSIKSFTDEDKLLLSTISNQLATAFENVHLYQQLRSSATLEERRRLARELHDGLSQSLGYLNMRSKYVIDLITKSKISEAISELEEFKAVTQELFQETRNNIFNLKCGVPDSGDFIALLQKYLQEYQRLNRFNIIFKSELRDLIMPGENLVHLIRIIQEALANVKKHSHADEVIITVDVNDYGQGVLKIEDNGIGMNLSEVRDPNGHYGLKIMEERVKLIGGSMTINSGQGKGVEFVIIIPKKRSWGA